MSGTDVFLLGTWNLLMYQFYAQVLVKFVAPD
jgi:hypothetical protein